MTRARVFGLVVAGVLLAAPATGQVEWTVDEDDPWCEDHWGGDDRERHCEVREAALTSMAFLAVDGGTNGGVEVTGWERDEIHVTARVWSRAERRERAREIVREVGIELEGDRVEAEGPRTDGGETWGVSYRVMVPRRIDLELRTHNGGISVEEVEGVLDFDATNGGVRLVGLAGDVRGRTRNGGLHVELEGDRWAGRGLDVETTNGGVDLRVPEGYSAELETGTVNGGLDLGFPITVRGRIGRRLHTTLGEGGPPVRATTTNGGVRIRRR